MVSGAETLHRPKSIRGLNFLLLFFLTAIHKVIQSSFLHLPHLIFSVVIETQVLFFLILRMRKMKHRLGGLPKAALLVAVSNPCLISELMLLATLLWCFCLIFSSNSHNIKMAVRLLTDFFLSLKLNIADFVRTGRNHRPAIGQSFHIIFHKTSFRVGLQRVGRFLFHIF